MNLIHRLTDRLDDVARARLVRGHPCFYEAVDIAARDVQPTSYLEIGVAEGASLLTVLAAAPSLRRLVLCDTWGGIDGGTGRGSHAHICELFGRIHYGGEAWFLDGLSRELIPTIPRSPLFDLATIDGEHTADAAAADLANVWPLLRPGGMLVMDDLERLPLRRAWDAFLAATGAERVYELDDVTNRTAIVRKREAA